MERARTLMSVVGTVCLMLMAWESVRQTDLARKHNATMDGIAEWIEGHIATEQAELFHKQLKQLQDEQK